MALFVRKNFISAAGLPLTWKIECDALTDEDWATIAEVCGPTLPAYGRALGVPTGGVKLAGFMRKFATNSVADPLLIVDDVWTTGKSIGAVAKVETSGPWIGFVAFARGPRPPHVSCFMATEK